MYYIVGQGFDALAEFYSVGNSIASPSTATAWASLLGSLYDIENHGFMKAKAAWDQTGQNEIWTFEDGDIWAALRVPGDGRANTYDVVLLHTAIIGNPSSQITKLIQSATNRLNSGREQKWV